MAIKKEPIKNVIITNTTVLYELNGIRGPILSPSPLPISKIYQLINGGINVYEVDPNDSKNKIQLTRDNYNKNNFKIKKKIEVPVENKEVNTSTDSTTVSDTNSESFNSFYNTESAEPTVVSDTNSETLINSYKNKKDKKNK